MARPELEPAAELFWRAWWELHDHRKVAVGFGVVVEQPIEYREAVAYARDEGFAGSRQELREFLKLMRAMDAELRAYSAEERAKAAPAGAGASPE